MKPRDAHLDNVKAILIVLVVIGHAMEPIDGPTSADAIYRFIYLFHMPAFVLVTGFLSRTFKARPKSYLRLVATIAVPYVVFQAIHGWIEHATSGEPFRLDLLTPAWTLWFLPAMFLWRALTPVLRVIPFKLPITVVVSLAAAAFFEHLPVVLGINRAIVLLPFFVLGLSLTDEHLTWVRDRSTLWRGRLLFTALGFGYLAIFTALTFDLVQDRTAFWNRETFAELGDAGPLPGLLLRVLMMIAGVVGTVAVVALASRRQHWWSYIGRYSLYVYLLHSIVLFPLQAEGLFDVPGSVLAVVLIAVAAVALAAALAAHPVRKVSQVIVEPPIVEPAMAAAEVVNEKVVEPIKDNVVVPVVDAVTENVVVPVKEAVAGTVIEPIKEAWRGPSGTDEPEPPPPDDQLGDERVSADRNGYTSRHENR